MASEGYPDHYERDRLIQHLEVVEHEDRGLLRREALEHRARVLVPARCPTGDRGLVDLEDFHLILRAELDRIGVDVHLVDGRAVREDDRDQAAGGAGWCGGDDSTAGDGGNHSQGTADHEEAARNHGC